MRSDLELGLSMRKSLRLFAAAALAATTGVWADAAGAQGTASMNLNGTTITVGGGVQFLQLPDVDFTFLVGPNDAVVRKQKNDDFDEYGGAFSGSIETPFGYWGDTPVTGFVSGFFANVEDSERHNCVSTANLGCTVEAIVDDPTNPNSVTLPRFSTRTDRDVDFWGVGAETRFGRAPAPIPDTGGYLFRFGYVGIGADVRGIDQDNRLTLDGPTPVNPGGSFSRAVNYEETLDTTYWGGYVSIGGEYNILGYLGMGSWGLRSLVSLRAGIYDAETDYAGRFTFVRVGESTRLNLTNNQVAFIGGATFETRKQFGPRTSLSLVTDYEWYSYAPEMKYVDADRGGCAPDCPGKVNRTHISDDDAFAVRTTLRLNIALGPALMLNR